MKIHFIGTCAGTEPFEDRNHACAAVEISGGLYWFDAGEACSRTGHLMGLDLLKVKKIMISHTHMDHVGGLANLLWHIRKLSYVKEIFPGDIDLYMPGEETARAVFMLLRNTEDGFCTRFNIKWHDVSDGTLFDEGGVKVSAYHNYHLEGRIGGGILNFFNDEKKWYSFSYRLEAEGKSVVYSGDVKKISELDNIIGDGCDALIAETGHHRIEDVYEYIKGKNVGKVFFSHNGREILNNRKESKMKVEKYFGDRAVICEDRMTVEI